MWFCGVLVATSIIIVLVGFMIDISALVAIGQILN